MDEPSGLELSASSLEPSGALGMPWAALAPPCLQPFAQACYWLMLMVVAAHLLRHVNT